MAVPEIAAGAQTAAPLVTEAWDAKLLEESALGEIFNQNQGIFNENTKQVPDSISVKVSGGKGETKRTFGMINRLDGDGLISAAQDLRGNEEAQTTREMTVYGQEWYHGVPTEDYGLKKVEQDPYGIYKRAQPQLSTWAAETRGRMQRQALLEGWDGKQTDATYGITALQGAVRYNPNFWVAGATSTVTYDSTHADHVTNIVNDLASATDLDVAVLNEIEVLATEFELEPVTINGKQMFVLLIGSRQKKALRTPAANSFFETLKDADVRGANNRALSGVLGAYGNLLICEDPRMATFNNNAGTVSYGYKGPGSSDGRNIAGGTNYDVAMLLGKGAMVDYTIENLHFETEIQKYNRQMGIGAFATQGYTRRDYDNLTTPTNTTIRNQSSATILLAK